MLGWLDTPFTFPEVADRKVLLVGLGGGCDIITAYAVSRLLPQTGTRGIVYGNTKKRDEKGMAPVSEHIRRFTAQRVHPDQLKGRTHGTTLIDRVVPRGDEGCPWIFLLTDRQSESALAQEIASLGFDMVFGVDTGGDSLTADALSGGNGRDRRMVRVLQKTGLPFWHIVVGPGSDGETSCEKLEWVFRCQEHNGRYRGCFSLGPILAEMTSLSAPLSRKRTPRIIEAAAAGRLHSQGAGRVVVPRGERPVVPREPAAPGRCPSLWNRTPSG